MKVYVENLAANRSYAIQVRGLGGTETEWSPTYVIQTERDRIPPPKVPNVKINGQVPSGKVHYWYGKDLLITWDDYSQDDESTYDHSYYMLEFVSYNNVIRTFKTSDRQFTLTQTINAKEFGGNGCTNFKSIRVWGVDKTGNPFYDDAVFSDGPFVNESDIYKTPSSAIINPAPGPVSNVSTNFDGKDAVFTWTLPSGIENADNLNVNIVLNDGSTSHTFSVSPKATQFSLTLDENRKTFGGSAQFSYSIYVVDAFLQQSHKVTGTITNLPPTETVANLQAIPSKDGITVQFDAPSISDYHATQIYEKIVTDSNDSGSAESLSGFTLIATVSGDTYSYAPLNSKFAKRWIKARHVDVFDQPGTAVPASATLPSRYPVQISDLVSNSIVAPAPATDLAVSQNTDGNALIPGSIYVQWEPPSDESLHTVFILYREISELIGGSPSWTTFPVSVDRERISSIDRDTVTTYHPHSFSVGDRVSIVNLETAGSTPQSGTVIATNTSSVTLDFEPTGTLINNSYDLDSPGTAIMKSYSSLSLMPGTKYELRVKSGTTAASSEPSDSIEFITNGSPLSAKVPIEVGTYYDPLLITSYSVVDNVATVHTDGNPLLNGFSTSNYVSIRNTNSDLDGRRKITSVAASSFQFALTVDDQYGTPEGAFASAGTFALGAEVNGINDGLFLDESNLWLSDTGEFRAGTNYGTDNFLGISWEPDNQLFTVAGDVNVRTGYFSGDVYLTGNGSVVAGRLARIDPEQPIICNSSAEIKIPYIVTPFDGKPAEGQKVRILSHHTNIKNHEIGTVTDNDFSDGDGTYIVISGTFDTAIDGEYTSGAVVEVLSTMLDAHEGLISIDDDGEINFHLSSASDQESSISGWHIHPGALIGPDEGVAAIYSGAGNYGNADTDFYLDSTGQFSLSHFFKADSSEVLFTSEDDDVIRFSETPIVLDEDNITYRWLDNVFGITIAESDSYLSTSTMVIGTSTASGIQSADLTGSIIFPGLDQYNGNTDPIYRPSITGVYHGEYLGQYDKSTNSLTMRVGIDTYIAMHKDMVNTYPGGETEGIEISTIDSVTIDADRLFFGPYEPSSGVPTSPGFRFDPSSGYWVVYRNASSATSEIVRFYSNWNSTANLVFNIRADGNVYNSNNSYGGLSDISIKENIVDAASQWDDIKNVKIRKYNLIGSNHTQIGVIAQEIEQISPGLVEEASEEHGSLKSVKYSILMVKAVKALQEAMARIETIEDTVDSLNQIVIQLQSRIEVLEEGI